MKLVPVIVVLGGLGLLSLIYDFVMLLVQMFNGVPA